VKREVEEQDDELLEVEFPDPRDAKVEINLLVLSLVQCGHSFFVLFSLKPTINSKLFPQSRHMYSYNGIIYSF